MATVLVVDDDRTVGDIVCAYLAQAGHNPCAAGDGPAALVLDGERDPDLIVLDLMMPGMDGLEVARRARHRRPGVPIIMLTARGEESDRIAGLEAGADDYVVKPFSPRELVLRVESVLRRASEAPASRGGVLRDGDLVLDLGARTVHRAGAPLSLTAREFDLLAHFLATPDVAHRRDELLEQVWGWTFGDQSTVTVHVRRLREKVEADPANPVRIVTVFGVGYRWQPS
jgi:DNA-binding response OmpR family regulator